MKKGWVCVVCGRIRPKDTIGSWKEPDKKKWILEKTICKDCDLKGDDDK